MINITPTAATKIKELMNGKAQEGAGLRLFVKSGGCRGFSYGMALDKLQEGDVQSETEGIKLFVDPESAKYLEGAAVDFKDAMMGGGFTIENPNATSSCGCGQSFKAKGEQGSPKSCC